MWSNFNEEINQAKVFDVVDVEKPKKLPWYKDIPKLIKAVPKNITLYIVSAIIFYKLRRLSNQCHHKRRLSEQASPTRCTDEDVISSNFNILPTLRRDMTVTELSAYDGTRSDGRILLAIYFNIYDVSRASHFYGPGGVYPDYAGKDISRCLVNYSSKPSECLEFDDLQDLNPGQMQTLHEWNSQYKDAYPLVGKLVPAKTISAFSNLYKN